MKDRKESLSELLASVGKVEIESICDKLRAIIKFTDNFTPEMTDRPQDEFLIHIAEVRKDAIALLHSCDKVSSNGDGERLTGIKCQFLLLTNFIEYLFALGGDEMVEQAHIAL